MDQVPDRDPGDPGAGAPGRRPERRRRGPGAGAPGLAREERAARQPAARGGAGRQARLRDALAGDRPLRRRGEAGSTTALYPPEQGARPARPGCRGKGREVGWRPVPHEAVVDGEVALGALLRPAERGGGLRAGGGRQPARPAGPALVRRQRAQQGLGQRRAGARGPRRPPGAARPARGAGGAAGRAQPAAGEAVRTPPAGWASRCGSPTSAATGSPFTARDPPRSWQALPPLAGPGRGAAAAPRAGGAAGPAGGGGRPGRAARPAGGPRPRRCGAPGDWRWRCAAPSSRAPPSRRGWRAGWSSWRRAGWRRGCWPPRRRRTATAGWCSCAPPRRSSRASRGCSGAWPRSCCGWTGRTRRCGWRSGRWRRRRAGSRPASRWPRRATGPGRGARSRRERLALGDLTPPTAPALEAAAGAARELGEAERAAGLLRTAVALRLRPPRPARPAGGAAAAARRRRRRGGPAPGGAAARPRRPRAAAPAGRPAGGQRPRRRGRAAVRRRRWRSAPRTPRPGSGAAGPGCGPGGAARRWPTCGGRSSCARSSRRSRSWCRGLEPAREPYEAPYAADAVALARAPLQPEPGDDVVVLADLEVVRLQPSGLASRYQQTVVKVLTPRGADEARRQSVCFTPGPAGAAGGAGADPQAGRHRGGGLGRPRDQRAASPGTGIYYDTRVRTLTFPALQPGDVLEVAWRLDDTADENLLSDYFGDLVAIDGGPAAAPLRLRAAGPGRAAPSTPTPRPAWSTPSAPLPGGLTEHRWQRHRRPALRRRAAHARLGRGGFRFLHVSTYACWDEVNRFYWGLVRDQLRPGAGAAAAGAAAGRGGAHGPRPPARAAGRRLATRSSRGAPPRRGGGAPRLRGDPDPLRGAGVRHPRLQALPGGPGAGAPLRRLQGQGLAHPRAARGGRASTRGWCCCGCATSGACPSAPASLAIFNHAILYVPSLDLWLDGTADHTGTRELPGEDRGATVLVVEPGRPAALRHAAGGPARGEPLRDRPSTSRWPPTARPRVEGDLPAWPARGRPALRRAYQPEADRQPLAGAAFAGAALPRAAGRAGRPSTTCTRLEEQVRQRYRASRPALRPRRAGAGAPLHPLRRAARHDRDLGLALGPAARRSSSDDPAVSRATLPRGAAAGQHAAPSCPGRPAPTGPHLAWALAWRAEPGLVVAEFASP